MASVDLRGLTKRFASLAVVDDVSLRIDHGQLVCLLGPSGCGKTTTLRLIAGFLEPSDGEIHVGDRLVSSKARTLPPEQRNMSMIFQSYALWPHMTVTENIVYGLRLRKLDRDTIAKKLAAILATTKLEALAQRYPGELSGGQQQRVALARALIVEPQTLLLDEPLSNLDANLREEMRFEIRRLHDEYRYTTVYVTHDQSEAMTTADLIAVMNGGTDRPARHARGHLRPARNRNSWRASSAPATSSRAPRATATMSPLQARPCRWSAPHSRRARAPRSRSASTISRFRRRRRRRKQNAIKAVVTRQVYLGAARDYMVEAGRRHHICAPPRRPRPTSQRAARSG